MTKFSKRVENWEKEKLLVMSNFSLFIPLAKGQPAIVMALCLSCVSPSVSLFVHECIHKLFLQKITPQKLLTGFLLNFTEMFLRWSSFKFLQIIVLHEEFWLPWQPIEKTSSQTTNWINILQECYLDRGLQNSDK